MSALCLGVRLACLTGFDCVLAIIISGVGINGGSSEYTLSSTKQGTQIQKISYLDEQSWPGCFFWKRYGDSGQCARDCDDCDVIVVCILFLSGYQSRDFVDVFRLAHGPAWQTLLHVEIAEQNLRVFLNHPFIGCTTAPQLLLSTRPSAR